MLRITAVLTAGALAAAVSVASAAPVYDFKAATSATQNAAGAQRGPSQPHDIVTSGVGELRQFLMNAQGRDPAQIREFLDRTIAPHFDFAAMGRWAAGPFYRRLSEPQRASYHLRLQHLFLASLARNLGSFATNVPPIQVLPPKTRRWGDETIVRARVQPQGGYPISVDFRFYRKGNEWRIFDVAANGFSAVTYYRRHFASLVRMHGSQALYR
jgi:phospholipid transport system substrate-binding protein